MRLLLLLLSHFSVSDSVWPHRRQPTRLPRPWDSPGKNTGVGCHFLLQCVKVKSESEVAQSCPTLHDPMDCSLPGSSVHGIFQAKVPEWGAIAFSVRKAWYTSFGSYRIHICQKFNLHDWMYDTWDCPYYMHITPLLGSEFFINLFIRKGQSELHS